MEIQIISIVRIKISIHNSVVTVISIGPGNRGGSPLGQRYGYFVNPVKKIRVRVRPTKQRFFRRSTYRQEIGPQKYR